VGRYKSGVRRMERVGSVLKHCQHYTVTLFRYLQHRYDNGFVATQTKGNHVCCLQRTFMDELRLEAEFSIVRTPLVSEKRDPIRSSKTRADEALEMT
jgi:hypothetical protein